MTPSVRQDGNSRAHNFETLALRSPLNRQLVNLNYQKSCGLLLGTGIALNFW